MFYAICDTENMQTGVAKKKQRREGKMENSHSFYHLEEDAKSRQLKMRLDD